MNKFLILIAALLFVFKFSNAQTDKGSQTLGGNVGLGFSNENNFTAYVGSTSTSTSNAKTTQFVIGPNYSYFIANNVDIGAAISYSNTLTKISTESIATTNDNNPVTQASYNFGMSLFIRKYYMYHKIGIRTEGYLGYTNGNTKYTYTPSNAAYNYNSTTNYYSAGANLDLLYYPAKNIGIAATLANLEYVHLKANNLNQGHDDGDSLNFNLANNGLSISVFYVFGKK